MQVIVPTTLPCPVQPSNNYVIINIDTITTDE